MSRLVRPLRIPAVIVVALTLTLQASCARSVDTEVESELLLVSPDAKNPAPLSVCVSTDCPAPWASCGDGLCTTDTSRDPKHCGSCDVACGKLPPARHATALCAGSKCVFACLELFADCNHDPGDGCEIYIGDDPKNCGACGNTCAEGEFCWQGACGCPPGFTQCGEDCKNLQTDSLNCGTCGKTCGPPKSDDPAWLCGPDIQPVNTEWGCSGGGCVLGCKSFFGDCNGDLCSDGCEVDELSDPQNCGACGHACGANETCVDGTCGCPQGTVRCGKRCVDVNVDPHNCGACGAVCAGPSGPAENGSPTCAGGECGYICYAGFADCDTHVWNGCEVEIGTDPLHCGACSTQCDASRSQPCVLGQCLTKPCDPMEVLF